MNRYKINIIQLVNDLLPSFLRKVIHVYWLFSVTKAVRNIHAEFLIWGQGKSEELLWNGQTIVLENFLQARYNDNRIRIYNKKTDRSAAFVGADGDTAFYVGADGDNINFIGTSYEIGDTSFVVSVPVGLIYSPEEMRKQVDRYKLYGAKFQIIEE